MRILIGIVMLCTLPLQYLGAQTGTEAAGDTTIYTVTEEAPRVTACENMDTTLAFKQQCAQQMLLSFIYQNLTYPAEAIRNDHEGTAVINFIVEKDGTISNPAIVRNVPGGCGEEALRVVSMLNPSGVRWVPGKQDGKAVRSQFTLPIRFRLSDARPFEIVGQDSIWTIIDEAPQFRGGVETLQAYLETEMEYPAIGNDSCLIGDINVQLVVRRDGDVKVLDLEDNSNLGADFWWEIIQVIHRSTGRWEPAIFKGEPVPAVYNITVPFRPTASACRQVITDYDRAMTLAEEGANLFNEGDTEAGIAKLSEAIELAPRNADLRYLRGQAYMETQDFGKACEDITVARELAPLAIFDTVLPFLCN